jgi:hypothetical protein
MGRKFSPFLIEWAGVYIFKIRKNYRIVEHVPLYIIENVLR